MKRFLIRLTVICIAAVTLVSGCECKHDGPDDIGYDKVMILYSAGFNSLSNYLSEDIKDLKKGYVPGKDSFDAILILSHQPTAKKSYQTPTEPVLMRLYKDKRKGVILDTLIRYSTNTIVTRAQDMRDILSTVKKQFPAKHYGLIYSSHSTGWLPKGYYSDPGYYESIFSGSLRSARHSITLPEGAVIHHEEEEIPGLPVVKSIGSTIASEGGVEVSYELGLEEFANALPMHFDYIIFDACLTGGVEVAYQLKDKCDLMAFSQTEVLAEGLDYTKLASRLLENETDVNGVAKDYYDQYDAKKDEAYRSATISVVDCRELDGLAGISRTLFEKYRTQIASLTPGTVQRYYTGNHPWFYDFEDILLKAGISQSESSSLKAELDKCIKYKAATKFYLIKNGGTKIEHFSGLSMYLPCNGGPYLDSIYKTLEWNKAAELVD